MKLLSYLSGAVFSSISVIAILFKLLHWVGADMLLFFGLLGIAFLFIPFFTIYNYNKKPS